MTALDPSLAGLNYPAAAIEQGDIEPVDLELLRQARLRHDRIRWWWGERIVEGQNGAYCYLCDSLVVTWQRSRPTTRQAVHAILEHRLREARRLQANPGTDAGGMSPSADAPTVGGQR